MTNQELDERIKDVFRRPIAWGNLIAKDEDKLKQLIRDCIEAVTPERLEIRGRGDMLEPNYHRFKGVNAAIEDIEENTKRLLS